MPRTEHLQFWWERGNLYAGLDEMDQQEMDAKNPVRLAEEQLILSIWEKKLEEWRSFATPKHRRPGAVQQAPAEQRSEG